MKCRILLYITPKFKLKYLANWLISIWTWSKYSHVEIWTTNGAGQFWYINNSFAVCSNHASGTCWTATMRGDANGTVKRPASEVLIHPKNWHYIEVDVSFPITMEVFMEAEVTHNKGYSKWDLLKFLSPIHFPDNKRNICSEFVNDALYAGGVFAKGGIVSPKKIKSKLLEMGYRVKKL